MFTKSAGGWGGGSGEGSGGGDGFGGGSGGFGGGGNPAGGLRPGGGVGLNPPSGGFWGSGSQSTGPAGGVNMGGGGGLQGPQGGWWGANWDGSTNTDWVTPTPSFTPPSISPTVTAPAPSFTLAPPPSLGLQPPQTPAWSGEIGLTNTDISAPSETALSFGDDDTEDKIRRFALGVLNTAAPTEMGYIRDIKNIADNGLEGLQDVAINRVTSELGLPGFAVNAVKNIANDMPANQVVDNAAREFAPGFAATTIGSMFGGPVGMLAGWGLNKALRGDFGPGTPVSRDPYSGGGNDQRGVMMENMTQQPKDFSWGDIGDWIGDNAELLTGVAGSVWANNNARGVRRGQEQMMQQQLQQQQDLMAQRQQIADEYLAMIQGPGFHVRAPNFGRVERQLANMFSTEGATGQQLRQELARKDAAAGRRSQYGPREVQLLAELTRLRAQAEPNYMNAEIGRANALNQAGYQNAALQRQGIYNAMQQRINALNLPDNSNYLEALFGAQNQGVKDTNQLLNSIMGGIKESGVLRDLFRTNQDDTPAFVPTKYEAPDYQFRGTSPGLNVGGSYGLQPPTNYRLY